MLSIEQGTMVELPYKRTIPALSERTLNLTTPSVRLAKCRVGPCKAPAGSACFPWRDHYRGIGTFVHAFTFSRLRKSYITGCWHPGVWEVLRLGIGPSFLPPYPQDICSINESTVHQWPRCSGALELRRRTWGRPPHTFALIKAERF